MTMAIAPVVIVPTDPSSNPTCLLVSPTLPSLPITEYGKAAPDLPKDCVTVAVFNTLAYTVRPSVLLTEDCCGVADVRGDVLKRLAP